MVEQIEAKKETHMGKMAQRVKTLGCVHFILKRERNCIFCKPCKCDLTWHGTTTVMMQHQKYMLEEENMTEEQVSQNLHGLYLS